MIVPSWMGFQVFDYDLRPANAMALPTIPLGVWMERELNHPGVERLA
jgi:hypothetical protein